jgi:hypothetical protein
MSMTDALNRIKSQLSELLPQRLIRGCMPRPQRETLFGPVLTTSLFARQVLHRNCSIRELRRQTKLDFAESSYCEARSRLDLPSLQRLARHVTAQNCRDEPTWFGHRMWLIDGTSFSMPDTPRLQQAFGQPGNQARGCGFPVAHLLCLFDAHDATLAEAIAAPMRTHDMAHAALTHEALRPGDVLVGDRAFCSYAHLALLVERGGHGIFRAHQRLKIRFGQSSGCGPKGMRAQRIRRLSSRDQLIEYRKPIDKPEWMSEQEFAALPESIEVRETRYRVRRPDRRVVEVTLVSTLLDAKAYPARELAQAYGVRWRAEVRLRELKVTLKLDVLKCETQEGVRRELAMMMLIYNLVRRVMGIAAKRQEVEPERISFIDALDWLSRADASEAIPRLKVNPQRERASEPRVRKRRPKNYPLMTRPREVLRRELHNDAQTDAA